MIELIHTLIMKLLEQNIVAKIRLAKHENNVMLFFNCYKKNYALHYFYSVFFEDGLYFIGKKKTKLLQHTNIGMFSLNNPIKITFKLKKF